MEGPQPGRRGFGACASTHEHHDGRAVFGSLAARAATTQHIRSPPQGSCQTAGQQGTTQHGAARHSTACHSMTHHAQRTWLASTSVLSMGCTPRFSSLRQKGFFTGSSFNLSSRQTSIIVGSPACRVGSKPSLRRKASARGVVLQPAMERIRTKGRCSQEQWAARPACARRVSSFRATLHPGAEQEELCENGGAATNRPCRLGLPPSVQACAASSYNHTAAAAAAARQKQQHNRTINHPPPTWRAACAAGR